LWGFDQREIGGSIPDPPHQKKGDGWFIAPGAIDSTTETM
jgi:hypothetical protein